MDDDEQRWAEAQAVLDRARTPSAEQRLRRWRNERWAAVAALGLLWRSGALRAWRQPALVLTRPQRRRLADEVRGRVPADPAHLPLARDLAGRMVDQRRQYVLVGGLAVLQVGLAITTPDTWRVATSAVLVIVFAAGAVLTFRDARRARRFLAAHPGPPADRSR